MIAKSLLPGSLLCVLAAFPNSATATLPGVNPELDRLYEQARALLDDPGDRAHEAASGILEAILRRDPSYVGAYVEYARFVLKSSFVQSFDSQDRFTEAGVEQAQRLLERAIAIEPRFADSYVLYGYLASAIDRKVLGLALLDEADRIGSTSGWAQLNRARILEMFGRTEQASDSYLRALDLVVPRSNEETAALEGLLRVGGSFEEMDRVYRTMIARRPASAVPRADYAQFLLRFGRFDAAIEYARRALSIDEGPHTRGVIGMSFYAKAADHLINREDPVRAALYFAEGRRTGYPPTLALLDSYAYDSTLIATFGLIEFGVNVNTARQGSGDTLLHAAVTQRDADYVEALLARGADPNVATSVGLTPLALAAANGLIANVEALLAAGADPNRTPEGGEAPIELALRNGHTETARLLETAGARRIPSLSEVLVEAVRQRTEAGIEQAIRYLEAGGSSDAAVVGALQDRFIEDPPSFFRLLDNAPNTANRVCGRVSSGAKLATQESLRDAAQRAFAVDRELTQMMTICWTSQRQAAESGPQSSLPEEPTLEQRRALLDRAWRVLDETQDAHRSLEFGDISRVAFALTAANPDDWEAHYLTAQQSMFPTSSDTVAAATQYTAQKREIAAASLEETLRTRPDFAEAYALYGHVLLKQGHLGIANLMLTRAEALGGTRDWTAVYRADYLLRVNDHEGAGRVLTPLLSQSGNRRFAIAVRTRLIDVYAATGLLEQARATVEELAALAPDDRVMARQRLEFFLYAAQDFERAAEIGEWIFEQGGSDDDMELSGVAMLARGASLLGTSGVGDAVQWFERGHRVGQDLERLVLRASRHKSTLFVLRALRDAGLSVNVADAQGMTPLFHAAMSGDVEAVAYVLSLGAEVDAVNADGLTPLHVAVLLEHEAVALELLDAKASARGAVHTGASREFADTEEFLELRTRVEEIAALRTSDDASIEGLRRAWPQHVRHALGEPSLSELPPALEDALLEWPRTVLEIAAAENRLTLVCGPERRPDSAGARRAFEARLAAISRVRDIQIALRLNPDTSLLDRCIEQLSRTGAV